MAKENGKKDFENIAELTKEFEAWRSGEVEQSREGNPFKTMDEIQMFQFRAMLAMAQQLAVISGTLKDLLALCKKQDKSNTE